MRDGQLRPRRARRRGRRRRRTPASGTTPGRRPGGRGRRRRRGRGRRDGSCRGLRGRGSAESTPRCPARSMGAVTRPRLLAALPRSSGSCSPASRPAAADDVVVLKNGGRLSGAVVQDDAACVVLEQTSGSSRTRVRIARDQVDRVERGAAPLPMAPGAPGDLVAEAGAVAPRDEWWLLRSGGQGRRHPTPPDARHRGGRAARLAPRGADLDLLRPAAPRRPRPADRGHDRRLPAPLPPLPRAGRGRRRPAAAGLRTRSSAPGPCATSCGR